MLVLIFVLSVLYLSKDLPEEEEVIDGIVWLILIFVFGYMDWAIIDAFTAWLNGGVG